MKRSYHTDLTDAQWRCLEPHVPAPNKRGRPRIHSPRTILDAVFYVLKSGCPWRLLPREFPPWETLYGWFRKWTINGTFERCRETLRQRGIAPRIARRGLHSSERLGRHRWVAERTLAWLNRYRRLKVRYERLADVHQAFLSLGCALVCWNFVRRACEVG